MHRIFIVFAVAAAVMLMVFSSAEWYANNSAVPRYCADRSGVIARVRLILTSSQPVGEGSKRPFIIAAKLIFLIPQKDKENIDQYLQRLTDHITSTCG